MPARVNVSPTPGGVFRMVGRALAASLLLALLNGCSALEASRRDPLPSPHPGNPTAAASATSPRPTVPPTANTAPLSDPTPTPSPTATRPPTTYSVMGYSVEGRPLEVFSFGTGPRTLMMIAGIHGGYEWNTIALADDLIAVISARPELIPPDVTLHILRSLNPDGEARSQSYDGRVNARRVDLNRNFPSHWQTSWPVDGCWSYTYVSPGTHPGSEPETQALMEFLLAERIEALISYHSAALGIFPGGQPPHAPSVQLAEALAGASDYPYPPIDTGCQYTGQLIDWAADHDIAAVDIELSNHRDTDLWQNLQILEVFLNWRP